MRSLILWLVCAALLDCTNPQESSQSLDGLWTLESAHSPVDPRTLTLAQKGASVTGTGSAMGVDAPMLLTVAGTITPPLVELTFTFTNGGGGSAHYTASLQPDGRLVGRALFNNAFGNISDSLTFVRH